MWADGYDRSVGLSDDDGTYPFAGYRHILNERYKRVLRNKAKSVLDIGFGTGVLAAKLYAQGCDIRGQDFSERMLALAREKMPDAKLVLGDFSQGLAEELRRSRYDAIIATYSLHHLSDEQKIIFLASLLPLLKEGGCIYIGDIAFDTREDLAKAKAAYGDEWDDDESYFVVDEMQAALPSLTLKWFSFCAGLFTLQNKVTSNRRG